MLSREKLIVVKLLFWSLTCLGIGRKIQFKSYLGFVRISFMNNVSDFCFHNHVACLTYHGLCVKSLETLWQVHHYLFNPTFHFNKFMSTFVTSFEKDFAQLAEPFKGTSYWNSQNLTRANNIIFKHLIVMCTVSNHYTERWYNIRFSSYYIFFPHPPTFV